MADELVPIMMGAPRWVPELDAAVPLLQRVFLAEKYLAFRLSYGHVDPREAGVGNLVNCGAAMYMAPVGVVNPGEPAAAYAEAIDMAGAHQSSFGREAAGVFAACVAAAVAPGATVASVVAAARAVAHDGTAAAIAAVLDAVAGVPVPADEAAERAVLRAVRAAVAPYDTVGSEAYRQPCLDARRPSRTKSIEELPVALGLLAAHAGDYRTTVLAAVNYGRDADSIAGMAGAIAAGLGGSTAVPTEWLDQIEAASKLDIRDTGRLLGEAATAIVERDVERTRARAARLVEYNTGEDPNDEETPCA